MRRVLRTAVRHARVPGLPRWLTGWQVLVSECTFPAVDPRVQLDHVLGHGDGLPAVTGGRSATRRP